MEIALLAIDTRVLVFVLPCYTPWCKEPHWLSTLGVNSFVGLWHLGMSKLLPGTVTTTNGTIIFSERRHYVGILFQCFDFKTPSYFSRFLKVLTWDMNKSPALCPSMLLRSVPWSTLLSCLSYFHVSLLGTLNTQVHRTEFFVLLGKINTNINQI